MPPRFSTHRRRADIAAAGLLFLLLALAGCTTEPAPPSSGGALPLQVYNSTGSTRQLSLQILDPDARSTLLTRETFVPPSRLASVDTGLLPHGEYVIVAKAGQVEREVSVDFGPHAAFFRFVVHPDVVAFQSG